MIRTATLHELLELTDMSTVADVSGILAVNFATNVADSELSGASSREERLLSDFAGVLDGDHARAARAWAVALACEDFERGVDLGGLGGSGRPLAELVSGALASTGGIGLSGDGDRSSGVRSSIDAAVKALRPFAKAARELKRFTYVHDRLYAMCKDSYGGWSRVGVNLTCNDIDRAAALVGFGEFATLDATVGIIRPFVDSARFMEIYGEIRDTLYVPVDNKDFGGSGWRYEPVGFAGCSDIVRARQVAEYILKIDEEPEPSESPSMR